MLKRKYKKMILTVLAVLSFSPFLYAAGVLPDTSVVIIDEAKHGGSINVKNTESTPVLLYSKITDLPDDVQPSVVLTRPIARLEPGQSQRVRFLLNNDKPLDKEHIKRVSFEGIPAKTPGSNKMMVTIKQDLPMIIVPKNLPAKTENWKDLNWSVQKEKLNVKNTGPYVVRLQPEIKLMPSQTVVSLKKTYILPGETLSTDVTNKNISHENNIIVFPVTRYGMSAGEQLFALNK